MEFDLKNKKALITGSSDGIGYAIAEQLAVEGAVVYINGRDKKRVKEAIDRIRKKYKKASLEPAVYDLGQKEQVNQLLKDLPKVDILINNLGIYEVKPFEKITDEDWLRIFEINVLSGIRLSRAYLPAMIKQNWGRILFVSSESAISIPKEMIHYGVTKTAQLAVSRGLAELTAGTNVTVNSILPGPTYSKGVKEFVNEMANQQNISAKKVERDFFKTVRPTSLIQRFATIEEVAALATFLVSERASAINGSSLRVDGGVIKSIY